LSPPRLQQQLSSSGELELDVTEVEFKTGAIADGMLDDYSGLVLYSMDRCATAFSEGDYDAIAAFVRGGGLVATLGDSATGVESYDSDGDGTASDGIKHCDIPRNDPKADSVGYLFEQAFGWKGIRQDNYVYTAFGTKYGFARDDTAAEGTVFDKSAASAPPAKLSGTVSYFWALKFETGDGTSGARNVEGAVGPYRSLKNTDSAGVWYAPLGKGTVLYVGFNWRSSGWSGDKSGDDWTKALAAGLTFAPNMGTAEPTTTEATESGCGARGNPDTSSTKDCKYQSPCTMENGDVPQPPDAYYVECETMPCADNQDIMFDKIEGTDIGELLPANCANTVDDCMQACEDTAGCCGFNFEFNPGQYDSTSMGRCVAKACDGRIGTSRYGMVYYARTAGAVAVSGNGSNDDIFDDDIWGGKNLNSALKKGANTVVTIVVVVIVLIILSIGACGACSSFFLV
jgi:hypothetical protein